MPPLAEMDANRDRRRQLSHDERLEILDRVREGQSHRKIANQMRTSKSTITRTLQRLKKTGSVDSRPRTGRPEILSSRDKRAIIRIVRTRPDCKHEELIALSGVTANKKTVDRMLKAAGIRSEQENDQEHGHEPGTGEDAAAS